MQSELPHTIEIAYGVIVDVASMHIVKAAPDVQRSMHLQKER